MTRLSSACREDRLARVAAGHPAFLRVEEKAALTFSASVEWHSYSASRGEAHRLLEEGELLVGGASAAIASEGRPNQR